MKDSSREQIPELNGLRGIAILMVLQWHLSLNIHIVGFGFGWTGVDLFFVLSGFLITRILLDTRSSLNYFRSFYGRRILRIFPVYYAALSVMLIVVPLAFRANAVPPEHDRLWYFLYLDNWTGLIADVKNNITTHFWSLAVEEQFYLLWPIVVFITNPKALWKVATAGISIALVLRIGLHFAGFDTEAIFRNTFCRMDALMIGALCATLWVSPERCAAIRRHSTYILGAGLALLLLLYVFVGSAWNSARMTTFGLTVVALAYGAFLLHILSGNRIVSAVLSSKPLTVFGRYSYGMYVYHLPIYFWVSSMGLRSSALSVLVKISLAFAVAALSFELVEKRINSLKSKFKPVFEAEIASSVVSQA